MKDYDVHSLQQNNQEATDAATASHVWFQYLGNNCLIAVGPSTKSFYRFDFPGAVVAVDQRDLASVQVIPQLRKLSEHHSVIAHHLLSQQS